MARLKLKKGALTDAFRDYERARRVWEVLSKKQQERVDQRAFELDKKLLKELGFTKEDLQDNVKDLQYVLDRLHEFTWHWDRRGPLLSRPGEPAPIAYIIDATLVIGPQFSEAHAAFAAYPQRQDKK